MTNVFARIHCSFIPVYIAYFEEGEIVMKKKSFMLTTIVVLLASIQVFAASSNFIATYPAVYGNNIEFISTNELEDAREELSEIEDSQISEIVNYQIENSQFEGPSNDITEESQLEELDIYIYEEVEPEEPEELVNYEHHDFGIHISGAFGIIPDIDFHEIITDDTIITSATTFFNRNVLYMGNLTINSNVNVSNANLVVLGTLNIENSGFLAINNADVYVEGDLRMQSRNVDGSFTETNGRMNISSNSRVTVLGNFYTQSTNSTNVGNSGAILELYGSFYQIGTNTFFRGMDGFIVAFSGEEQRVSFDRFDINATLYSISGANESRMVHFDTPVWQVIPTEDATIFGENVTIRTIRYSRYTVTINGDFVARTAGGIQSELVVNGSFYATNGIVTSQVDITIKQDLRHQAKNEDGTHGITTGALSMNPGRKVTVLGNFYTQSTAGFFSSSAVMELHGNFSQIGIDTRFAPMDSFTLVFAGSEHRVSFDRHDSNAILRGVSGANASRRVYLDTPIHAVWLAEDAIFYGDSSITFLHPNWNTARFMGSLENLREIQNGNAYIGGDFISLNNTLIGHESTVIVNGDVYVHNGLRLGNPTSRLSIRGNLYNGLGTNRVSSVTNNAGGLLDLKGDYIQADCNEGLIESGSTSRMQLSGNSIQRIFFPAGRRVHFNNLHIRNQPSSYNISNGLNTYTFAEAIANLPNSPKIWTNLFYDIEEVTIPNIPQPEDEGDPDNSTYGRLIMIISQEITDERLSEIVSSEGIPRNVKALNFDGNLIRDISPLIRFTHLEGLWLDSNIIDDVNPLARLVNLRELWLVNNNISDISPLMSLTNLEHLYLWQNPITHEQVNELQEALPHVTIEWDGGSSNELFLAATDFNSNFGWSKYLLSHENIRNYFDTPDQLSEFLKFYVPERSHATNVNQSDSLLERSSLSTTETDRFSAYGFGWSAGTEVTWEIANGRVTHLSAAQFRSSDLMNVNTEGFCRRLPSTPNHPRSGLVSYFRVNSTVLPAWFILAQRINVYGNGNSWSWQSLDLMGSLPRTWG